MRLPSTVFMFLLFVFSIGSAASADVFKKGSVLIGKYADTNPTSIVLIDEKNLEYCFRKLDEKWGCWYRKYKRLNDGLVSNLDGGTKLTIVKTNATIQMTYKSHSEYSEVTLAPLRSSWDENRYYAECVQRQLNHLEFDVGTPDGKLGKKSKAASKAYNSSSAKYKPDADLSQESARQWCEILANSNDTTKRIANQAKRSSAWAKDQRDVLNRIQGAIFKGSWKKGFGYDIKFGRGKSDIRATVTVIDSDANRSKYVMPAKAMIVGNRVQLQFTKIDRRDILTYDLNNNSVSGYSLYRGSERNKFITAQKQ